MFSSRLAADLTPNRLMGILEAKRAAGVEVIDLTESNPTRAGFSYEHAEVLGAMAQPGWLEYRPSPRGLAEARQAIAHYYLERAARVDPESIFLTASTSEAYGFLFKLLASPEDEVLVPRPSYPLLDLLAALEAVRPIPYRLDYGEGRGWRIDVAGLRASIGRRTAAVAVVHPNNPTGSFASEHERDSLNRIGVEHNLALIVDEVFLDYASESGRAGARTFAGNEGPLTFVVSGLSKVAGLPQVKLGWIQVSGPEPLYSEAVNRLEFIADTYLSVGSPAQHAASRLLAGSGAIREQIRSRIELNSRLLGQRCRPSSRCRLRGREGGWYAALVAHGAPSDEELACQLLAEDNVLVHPGHFYDFDEEGVFVVSLLPRPESFEAGISKLLARIGGAG